MKTSDEIIENVKNGSKIDDYDMLEMHLHLCISQILKMYANGFLSKEDSNKYKNIAVNKYKSSKKQYEFETNMFREHIKQIKDTEMLRTNLRKRLNEEDEITEEKLAECLNLALEILSICFKGEF